MWSIPPGRGAYGAHWGAIAATDFFTVEVVTSVGLVRYFVLFVIDLKSRCVHIAGIAHQVYGKWTEQVARSLTAPSDGFLRGARYLIHDRDPLFTRRFAQILKASGVRNVRLSARSPNPLCPEIHRPEFSHDSG